MSLTQTRPSSGSVSECVDVAVVGAGPAGASAARLLASWGVRVSLLARPASGRAHAESLPPSCAKLFDRIGVREAIDAADFVRATGNTVCWGAGEAARAERFGGGDLGYQLSRDALDAVLVQEARIAGARVIRRARVREVSESDASGERTVHYERGGVPLAIAARWVLDCTGRAGLLARRERTRGEGSDRTLAIIGAWESERGWGPALDDQTHTLVESYADGWTWSVPLGPTRRHVAVMVEPGRATSGRARLVEAYGAELAKTNAMRDMVAQARPIGAPWARDASPYRSQRAGAPGLLLVGDAASFVDPLSSYGVKKALASAWLAAVVAHTCLTASELMSPALALYESRERAMYAALQRRRGELAGEAAAVHASEFWFDRARVDATDGADDEALGWSGAPAAFAELKRRAEVRLRPGGALHRLAGPLVQGSRIVLAEHLSTPVIGRAVRYVRNVDVVRLVEMAPRFSQVPDLYEAYNGAIPPAHRVALPDFLGALALLVGGRALEFA